MADRYSTRQNVLESGFSTVTSGGHWFHATRDTVDTTVPGLLERYDYEDLIMSAVLWIESTDSLSMILFFILIFLIPAWPAVLITIAFYVFWYFNKSAMVTMSLTSLLKVANHEAFQLGIAAIALSALGIYGNYLGLLFGILFFFLFKVGLLRLFISRFESRFTKAGIPLNDRVLKMVLIRHAIYEDLSPPEISRMEDQIKEAILKFKRK